MLIVMKFGGSSVADAERIKNVALRIGERRPGNQIIVVLSAQGDTTDDLIKKAAEISVHPSKRELDMLISTGEQQSAALLAIALIERGLSAVSLNATQAGITSSKNHGNARIKNIDTERIIDEIDHNNIVIITGFQGVNKYHDVATLGRGGSDTTAVALAAALNADACEIYTDVDGIFTADPRAVKTARLLSEITYDEMMELASLGARVLHNRSVELAKKYNVNLVVRSSLTRAEGTAVKEVCVLEKTLVSGVAIDKEVARISIMEIEDVPGMAFKVFSLLAKRKISVDLILQSIGRNDTKDISFTVSKSELNDSMKILNANKESIGFREISYDEKIAKLSVVGAGIVSNFGVASSMFEALYDGGINISMISTSEIKISVLIDERDSDKALTLVHDKFLDNGLSGWK